MSSIATNNANSRAAATRVGKRKQSYALDRSKSIIKGTFRVGAFKKVLTCLTDAQRARVIDVGFGGLLSLDMRIPLSHMNEWLLESFDPISSYFRINDSSSFVETANDVHDLYLIPRNEGVPVPTFDYRAKCDQPQYHELRRDFIVALGGGGYSDHVEFPSLVRKLNGMKEATDDFVRFFILAAHSMILNPNFGGKVDFSILKVMINIDKIIEYDWCGLVLDRLSKGLIKFKKDNQIRSAKNRDLLTHVSGSLASLLLIYFQHVPFRKLTSPTSLPIIKHWCGNLVNERILKECQATFFGQGVVIMEPVCKELVCTNHMKLASSSTSSSVPPSSRDGTNHSSPHSVTNENLDCARLLLKFSSALRKVYVDYVPTLLQKARVFQESNSSQTDSQFYSDEVLYENDEICTRFFGEEENFQRFSQSQKLASSHKVDNDCSDRANSTRKSSGDLASLWRMSELGSALDSTQNESGAPNDVSLEDFQDDASIDDDDDDDDDEEEFVDEEDVSLDVDDVVPKKSALTLDINVSKLEAFSSFKFFARFLRQRPNFFKDYFDLDELKVLDWYFIQNPITDPIS